MKKVVYVYIPCMTGSKNSGVYRFATTGESTIYQAMDFILENPYKLKITRMRTPGIKLAEIINLHNTNGIKNPHLLPSFIMTLETGKHLVNKEKIPNIRLTKTVCGKWVLFDGHHSLLAYFFIGKKKLHEVPHLIIVNKELGYVNNDEICTFFGKHAVSIKSDEWANYVINWQASISEQLCKRVQKTMGELYESLAGTKK
jgi:hypothetical protein